MERDYRNARNAGNYDRNSGRNYRNSDRDSRYSNRNNGYNRRYKKKKSPLKIVLIIIAVLLLLAVVLVGAGYAVFKAGFYGKSNYVKNEGYTINRDAVEEETNLDAAVADEVVAKQQEALKNLAGDMEKAEGTYNILLIGVDRRDSSWYGNSDVMMLITINNERKTIYMTSFLRDLYANIPEVGVRKLNASCAYGGAELCVETIKQNYGVQIDNYAMVDFDAMIDIIDALDGIDLELTAEEVEVANGYVQGMCAEKGVSFEEHRLYGSGMMHLDGYQALAFARNRYTGNTYDFGRTERQRKVLNAIFEKAKSGSLGSLTSAAQSVLPYVTHDIPETKVLQMISKLPGWLGYKIEEQHIPYDNMYHSENEILIPDMEATISKLLQTIY